MEKEIDFLISFEKVSMFRSKYLNVSDILNGKVEKFKITFSEYNPESNLKPPYYVSTFVGEIWTYRVTELIALLRSFSPDEKALTLKKRIEEALFKLGYRLNEFHTNYHTSLFTYRVEIEKLKDFK